MTGVQTCALPICFPVTISHAPKVRNSRNGGVFVTNQTIIPVNSATTNGTVKATGDIVATNTTVFPFLAQIAQKYDEIKWHKIQLRWIPALPTTAGGTVAMYFDSDRKDAAPADLAEALQNKGCVISPVWRGVSYNLTRQQLRTNEMFTTGLGSTAANSENIFTGPGVIQVLVTPLVGVTISAATPLGSIEVVYTAELMFPSGSSGTVPTRKSKSIPRGLYFTTNEHLQAYHNFCAGCDTPPGWMEFLELFDENGDFNARKAVAYGPDTESFEFERFLGIDESPSSHIMRFSGGLRIEPTIDPLSDFLSALGESIPRDEDSLAGIDLPY